MPMRTAKKVIMTGSNFDPVRFPGLQAFYDLKDASSYITATGVKLLADKSGNSGVNVLALNGVAGNYASAATATAFGTGDFTVSAKLRVNSLAATGTILHGGANSFSFTVLITTGTLQTGLPTVGNNTASTGALVALTDYVVTYVRSGTTGTYYINGVSAGTTTDSRNYSVASRFIGMAADGTSAGLVGNIEWVHAYSVALDASGIAADMTGAIQANSTFDVAFSSASKLATSFTATTGGTVTINTSGDLGARICGARDLVQMTGSKQPTLSGGGALFDGSDDYMKAAAFSLAQPTTVYFVGQQVTWTMNDQVWGGNSLTERNDLYQNTTSPNLTNFAGSNGGTVTALAVATNGVLCAVYNGASSSLRLNRTAASTGNAGAQSANGFTLGARGDAAAFGNINTLGILVYSGAHDAATQNRVIQFLGRYYGIAV